MPVLNGPAQPQDGVPGASELNKGNWQTTFYLSYRTLAEKTAAANKEIANPTNWPDRARCNVVGQAATFLWNAAQSHFRDALLPGGRIITMANDLSSITNIATPFTTPTGGGDTDVILDMAANCYWTKAGSADSGWAITGPILIQMPQYLQASLPAASTQGERVQITDYYPTAGRRVVGATYHAPVGTARGKHIVDGPQFWYIGFPDGVTDNSAELTDFMEDCRYRSSANCGQILFGPGEFAMQNVSIPQNFKLKGFGTTRYSGGVAGTRLRQLAGSTNSIIQFVGASTASRLVGNAIESLTLYGNGLDCAKGLLYLHHVSYFVARDIWIVNSVGYGMLANEVWDSCWYNFRVTACGNAAGTRDAVRFGIEAGDTDNTNQCYLYDMHLEGFPGTGLRITGTNCGQVFIFGAKIETGTGNSKISHVVLNGVVNCYLGQVDICGTLNSSLPANAVTDLLNIVGCTGIRGHVSLKMSGGSTVGPNAYMTHTTSTQTDLSILMYGTTPTPINGFIINWDGVNRTNNRFHCTYTAYPLVDPALGYWENGRWFAAATTGVAGRALTGLDRDARITCLTGNQSFTVPTGTGESFSPMIVGVSGSVIAIVGATANQVINDCRNSIVGATPIAAIRKMDTTSGGVETFDVFGVK